LEEQQSRVAPVKLRFFRRQMNNMIAKACQDLGIPAPSRRTLALYQWLQERMEEVPNQPGYQPVTNPPEAPDNGTATPTSDARCAAMPRVQGK